MAASEPALPLTLICLQPAGRRGTDWGTLAAHISPIPMLHLAETVEAARAAATNGDAFALAAAGADAAAAMILTDKLIEAGIAPRALLLLAPVMAQGAARPDMVGLPTLVVAVHGETPSSPETLRARLIPHLPYGRLLAHDGPDDTLILRHGKAIGAAFSEILMTDTGPIETGPAIDPAFAALLASGHVSQRTREVMEQRAKPDFQTYAPKALTPEALAILRAATLRVLPQEGVFDTDPIDLAARIDIRLATTGDGWRFAELPPDAQAYEQALHTLDRAAMARNGVPFVVVDAAAQDDLLTRASDGTLQAEGLSAAQMQLWFTDLRADCVQTFITHPATMGRLGIDSIANGGDPVHQGFAHIGLGQRTDWEPTGRASLGGDVA